MEEQHSPVFTVGIYARISVDHYWDSIKSDICPTAGPETAQAVMGDENASVNTQIAMAKAYLEKHKDMVLYDCYIDIGRSGTNFHRAGFERLMQDIQDKKVNCIIVKDLSRLGRNYIETGDYLERIFPLMGVRFISLTDGMDSLCSYGSDSLGADLKNLINELYAEDISVKVKSSKQLKLEQGSYTGGLPPYGYLLRFCNGRKILSENPEPAGIVRGMFDRYADGESLSGLVRWLYRSQVHRPSEYHRYGHVCRKEGEALRQWSTGSLRNILSNPVYLRCPVVERKVFDRVQERLELGAEQRMEQGAGKRLRQGPEKILEQEPDRRLVQESILYCGSCGRRLHRARGRNGKNVYSCCYSARLDELRCNTKSISAGKLTDILNNLLEMEYRLRGIGTRELELWEKEEIERRLRENELKMAAAERGLRSEQVRVSELYRRYHQGLTSRHAYQKAKADSDKRADGLKEQLKMLECNKIKYRKRQLTETQNGKETDFKMLLGHMIIRIEIYPDKRMNIYFKFHEQ